MNPEQAEKLRARFPDSAIGKRPQVNCGACTQATKAAKASRDKHCEQHRVTECAVCKAYITTAHIHLDFVGHAATTDRLLSVDPEWTWEPMGIDEQGLPATDRAGNLWIKLTICGLTRPGVGDGPTAKEAIGDAIRNAAMRFGVALDLWSKTELEQSHTEEPEKPTAAADAAPPLAQARARVWKAAIHLWPLAMEDERLELVEKELGSPPGDADATDWNALADRLERRGHD